MSLLSSGGPVMDIKLTTDDGRRVSFTTQPGFIYIIEQSTNLTSWSVLDTLVADDTNEAFYAFGPDARFYRVIEGSDAIQLPNFSATVDQSCYIDLYTPLTGSGVVDVYANGNFYFRSSGTVPASGSFRVSDGLYNPANWPYDGLYNITNWEFRVGIISPAATGGAGSQTNQGIVYKKGKIRKPIRTGIAVYQRAALPEDILAATEEEFLEYMRLYFLANLSASRQVDLDGALLNEFIEGTQVPVLIDTNDVARFRRVLFNSLTNQTLRYADRLHYFGHGASTSFGGIRVDEVRTNVSCLYPFTYLAVDGCNTAEPTDLIGEYTCYWKATTLEDLRDRGLIPGYGCGWDRRKGTVQFPTQGSLLLNHFDFWVDFYGLDGGLTHRDIAGLFDITYEQAYNFARTPNRNGVDPNRTTNPEATGFVQVGCLNCFFDL
jgi:hypothetical protein